MVMDGSQNEEIAGGGYLDAPPDPLPMERAEGLVKIVSGTPVVFRHLDSTNADSACVWVLWATAGTGDAEVLVPLTHEQAICDSCNGTRTPLSAANHRVPVRLRGDSKMAPPVLLIDR